MLRSCDWIVSLRPWSKITFPRSYFLEKKTHHAMAEAMSRTFGSTRSRSLAVWAPRTFHEPRAIEGAVDSGTIWDSDVVHLLPNCFSTFWLNLGWHFATPPCFFVFKDRHGRWGCSDLSSCLCNCFQFFLSNLISLSYRIVLDFHVHLIQARFSPACRIFSVCLVSWVPKRTKGTRGGQRQWHVQGWLRWGRGATSGLPLHCRTTQVAGTSAGHRCTATVLFVLRLLQLSCSECPLKKRGGCKRTDVKHINILNISAIPSTRYQFRKFQSNPFQFCFMNEGTCQEWRTCHLYSKMWPGPSMNGLVLCRGCALWWSAWTHKTITLVTMHRVDEECSLSSTQSSMELSPTGMKLVQQEIALAIGEGGRRWRVSLWRSLIAVNTQTCICMMDFSKFYVRKSSKDW